VSLKDKHHILILFLKHQQMLSWNLSIESKKPIGNGIITCLNMKQAKARKKKGAEATSAVIVSFIINNEILL
jgi:6,7-dimethyl-8-ribityllumazine synthase